MLAWNVFTLATNIACVHHLVIGTITSRVLIDCEHMLYNQCGIILVGDNVKFAITGRVNCTMFKDIKCPRFIFM